MKAVSGLTLALRLVLGSKCLYCYIIDGSSSMIRPVSLQSSRACWYVVGFYQGLSGRLSALKIDLTFDSLFDL